MVFAWLIQLISATSMARKKKVLAGDRLGTVVVPEQLGDQCMKRMNQPTKNRSKIGITPHYSWFIPHYGFIVDFTVVFTIVV